MSEVAEEALSKLKAGFDGPAIFGDPPDKAIYRRLAKAVHPDHNSSADAAALFHAASEVWEGRPNPLAKGLRYSFHAAGSTMHIRPREILPTASGVRLTGERFVAYEVGKECLSRAMRFYGGLTTPPFGGSFAWHFGAPEIKVQCLTGPDGFLPRLGRIVQDNGHRILVWCMKPDSYVPLNLVLKQQGGKLDPKHVAWILSGLYNAACYMEHTGLVYLGLVMESIVVEPDTHRVMLPGGWEHAYVPGEKPGKVPLWVANQLPSKYKGGKPATLDMTLELIRAMGRVLLGDPYGSVMIRQPKTAMSAFLLAPAKGSAIDQYRDWRNATASQFGGHHFHPMDSALTASPSIVYEEIV